MKKFTLFLLLLTLSIGIQAQSLEHHWQAIDENGNPTEEYLKLNPDSTYSFSLEDGEISSSGTWDNTEQHIHITDSTKQEDLALQYHALTDSTMNITVLGETYRMVNKNHSAVAANLTTITIVKDDEKSEISPSQGITFWGIVKGLIGLAALILILVAMSENRRAISWKLVAVGIGSQILIAVGIQKVAFIGAMFEWVSRAFVKILDFSKEGATFIFGDLMDHSEFGYIFAFQVLPTIIFFSALTSALFYLGIIQKVVGGMARVMTKLMGISGAESLSVAGNIFLGQTEAPLMIKPYISRMSRSEILLVMVGGMSTLAGGVLAAYISFLGGDDPVMRQIFAKNLLMASVMAAPGAVVASKILCPQTEKVDNNVKVAMDKIGSNFLDAVSRGTSEGLKLAANVAAMLVVFVAFIALFNYVVSGLSSLVGLDTLVAEWTDGRVTVINLQSILGFIFYPLMGIIGVPWEDCANVGSLLGLKVIMSEFVGYTELAAYNAAGVLLNHKSIIMATFILSGFANFASIGIQIGGIGSLAPEKRSMLASFGIKALIAGSVASLLSATIAGALIG